MLNHAEIQASHHADLSMSRRASFGAGLSPAEAGKKQGKADKEAGEPEDLNYGPSHFTSDADVAAANKAYAAAYAAASAPADKWIWWLGLAMASGLALFAFAFKGKKDSGGADREAVLPPEPSVYGLGAGSSFGTDDPLDDPFAGDCTGAW
jgi:hypothetical protein